MESIEENLEALLREPDVPLPDEGFSRSVMAALPRRKTAPARASRWSLAGAAVAGGLVISLFGTPLEHTVGALGSADGTTMFTVALLVLVCVAVPVAWALYPEEI